MPWAPKGHKPPKKRTKDERRSSAARGYDYQWQQFRLRYLTEHPLCMDCAAEGLVRAATDVHHTRKLVNHPESKYEVDTLMALCGECHSVRTKRGE